VWTLELIYHGDSFTPSVHFSYVKKDMCDLHPLLATTPPWRAERRCNCPRWLSGWNWGYIHI
jgi:hypothetical protein